ncbi:hypothetical protein SVI_2392 [Shewanella violacea DSS12]|uniref:Uncharacterized protein n=1 Tax=Shewanella violacea (strain JCM 10179 / CIP 106290 / LMG 19151 / DSS12) TaxID=637905 RepID=D4ZL14_SHEVD|nr:hypothetical protein SVI_2392 [Shewanella violacea DSS12]
MISVDNIINTLGMMLYSDENGVGIANTELDLLRLL